MMLGACDSRARLKHGTLGVILANVVAGAIGILIDMQVGTAMYLGHFGLWAFVSCEASLLVLYLIFGGGPAAARLCLCFTGLCLASFGALAVTWVESPAGGALAAVCVLAQAALSAAAYSYLLLGHRLVYVEADIGRTAPVWQYQLKDLLVLTFVASLLCQCRSFVLTRAAGLTESLAAVIAALATVVAVTDLVTVSSVLAPGNAALRIVATSCVTTIVIVYAPFALTLASAGIIAWVMLARAAIMTGILLVVRGSGARLIGNAGLVDGGM